MASHNHGRLAGLLEKITAPREAYGEAWLRDYTTLCMASALGRWDVEYEYQQWPLSTIGETLDQFKDGEELPGWRL